MPHLVPVLRAPGATLPTLTEDNKMTDKTKHTPGPWHTDPGQSFYVFAHGSLMEQAGVNNGPFVCNASTQANARLIAAAPELLASLRRVLKMLELNDARLANFGEVEEARGIISRAEGAPYWGE